MNILYIPFFTIQNKMNNLFNLKADNNIRYAKQIIEKFNKDYSNIKFDIILPKNSKYENLFNYNNIDNKYEMYIPSSNILQRFHFDTKWFIDNINFDKYDYIINNNDTCVKNLKSLFYKNDDIKIINWLHYPILLDSTVINENVNYFIRQAESILISDYNFLFTKNNAEKFEKEMKKKFNFNLDFHIDFLNMSFSTSFIDKFKTIRKKKDKIIIIFPNRLSSNNYSHYIEFIKAVNLLYKNRQDFEVIMTNPTQYIPQKKLSQMLKPKLLNKNTLSKKEYYEALWESDIAVSLLKEDIHGGTAIREAIQANCLPVIPKLNDYKDLIIQNINFPTVDKNLNNLEYIINVMIDKIKYNNKNKIAKFKNNIKIESFEYNIKKLEEIICD